jgi:CheY-specific phosphatase CheX
MSNIQLTLREILAGKAQELFNAYGVACSTDAVQPEPERLLCGILGFTGDHLCGSLVISASERAIAESNPIHDGATRAWVAELTNQLVGRFKNALLRYGVEIAMSIPVVLTAAQLTPLPQTQADPIRLDVGGGSFAIWLEVEASSDLTLADPGPESMIAAEGEAMLF